MTSQSKQSSSSTPSLSISTALNSSLPPPPPTFESFQRSKDKGTGKSATPVFDIPKSGNPGGKSGSVSDEEFRSVISLMKQHMAQQQQTNKMVLNELKELRSASKKPVQDVETPLRPRILNFDSAGSYRVQDEDIIPMQNSVAGATASTRTATTRDMGFSSGYSSGFVSGLSSGYPTGSFPETFSHNIFANKNITNDSLAMQDTGINATMAREIQKLKDMISSVPGVIKPIPEVSDACHKISRFAPPICDAEIPKRFQTPSMKLYDGSTDPEEHIAQYRERMEINPIPVHLKEACLCKGFGSTLTGPALKWLLNLPPYSITSFAHLINMFNSQFSCSRAFERLTTDLYRVVNTRGESLREYVNKFSKEALDIPNLDMATAVQAFKMGLPKDSAFYEDLVMNPCRNLDEVRNKALRFIRLEEDRKIQQRIDGSSEYENPNRKSESSLKHYRSKPYSRNDSKRVHYVEDDEDDEEYPKLSDYCFSVSTPELIYAMQGLGEKARWPRRNEKNPGWKDKSKWCAFHEDFGHLTEDCIALRKEISYLLSKGHLKELLGKKKDRPQDTIKHPDRNSDRNPDRNPDQDPERNPKRISSPPPDASVVYFISGGSDICGTSYSAAKRHAKEAKSENGDRPNRKVTITEGKTISFDDDDMNNVQDPHHDGLVITLYVANHFVRRILIDGGSSVNIIQLQTLKKMNIPDSEITSRSSVLVGFSGETKSTIGEIRLPVYIKGVNSMQKFCVMDCLSCYNIILGRPWIHDMKAVPSTYHQCVKLPTPWGVVKIESDQQEAKDCYTSSMKASTQNKGA